MFPPLTEYYPHLQTVSAPQAAFLVLDNREAFYGGAVGGGKSDALLMAALQYVDRPGYNALLLRRTFPELEGSDGLIAKAHEWLGPHRRRGELDWNEQKHRWTFPSGATLQFGHVATENDKYRYQGQAYQFVGFDELTHFTESIYEYIAFTRARRNAAQAAQGIPVRARAASNPGNIGHGWVKQRFITARRDDVIFVPAKLHDNPGLRDDDAYAEGLSHLPEELRLQLLEGDWDAFEGAAYQVGPAHLLAAFEMQNAYSRFEAADYGLNGAPWALVAVDYEGNLIFADMLYERDLIPSQLCPLILAKRAEGWGDSNVAHVDPSIWHRTGAMNKFNRPAMLADEFTDNGVAVFRANNDPRAGMMRLRELLEPDPAHPFPSWHPLAGEPGAPRVFFHGTRCERLVQELQNAPLQPTDKPDGGEKVDPEWESRSGHAAAMARYAVMTRPAPSTKPNVPDPLAPPAPPEQLRREALARYRERHDRAAPAGAARNRYAT